MTSRPAGQPRRLPGRQLAKRTLIAADRVAGPVLRRLGFDTKAAYEMAYWRSRHLEEKTLGHGFYERQFTSAIGVERSFYAGKRVLDVGCGPRGSLEWADDAAERVGLDSLAERYRRFGIDDHAMDYIAAGAEAIPFDDGHFDVVTSYNSLDHVDDVDASVDEMLRVLAPGGTLVIVVDIHRKPTVAEPHTIPWDLGGRISTNAEIVDERHLEKGETGTRLYGEPYDHDDPTDRYGVLMLRAIKR